MENKEYEPDIIELQSWLCMAEDSKVKNFWLATKYLSSPYSVWLSFWRDCGKPNIWN
jgi:hypothetical protein